MKEEAKYFYKIKNTKTGLYKMAGSPNYRWSKSGKVWKNLAALMGHFSLYGRNRERILEATKDCIIEMYLAEPSEVKSVSEFLQQRWESKK